MSNNIVMKKGSTFYTPVKVIKTKGLKASVIEVNNERYILDNRPNRSK